MTAPHLLVAGTVPAASTARRTARELLRALGADVEDEGLEETPRRVAHAYSELLTPRPFRANTFPNEGYDQLDEELEPKGVGVVLEAEHLTTRTPNDH
jgi:GTP cyclohydrolase I